MHNMTKKKSPTPAATGSDSTTGKTAEQPVEHMPGNGGDGSAPRTKVLKNNAIYDLDKGRIVGFAGPNPYAINQSNSNAMSRLRWDKVAEAQAQAIESIRDVSFSPTGLAAWGKLVGFRYERAMDADNKRGTEDARLVGHATGYLPLNRAGDDASGGLSVTAHVSGDALAGLFSLLAGKRAEVDGDVVADGDIRDGEVADVDGE